MYSSTCALGTPVKPSPKAAKEAAVPCASAAEAAIDAGLVRRFNAGDDAAFVAIMERYRTKIFTVTLSLLRNHADAEEITQDTFIRAHRGLARFRGDSSLSTWLYRIAVNLSRNRYWYFFRRRRQDSLSLDCALSADSSGTFSDLVADVSPDPAQQTASGEFTRLVDACMDRLDARHREILTLRNVLNQSYEEIAQALGINVGTVKSRIARARENLRALLAEACPEFSPDSAPSDWFIPTRSTYGHPVIAST
jgi:RNA polymerase sigma-70 factor (ECF subfamily)